MSGNGTAIAERQTTAPAQRPAKTQPTTLAGLLESRKDAIATVLPKHLDADRLLKIALVAVSKNDLLMKCSHTSILQSVMTAAQLGLDCGGALGSAYLVPFYIKQKGCYECQLVVGYRGLIDLARRSGQIASIEARIVYQNDVFELDYSIDGTQFKHQPCLDGDPGPMRLVYGIAKLKDDGGHQFEIMTKAQVEKIKALSQTGRDNKGPWRDHYDEMARKTVVKRLAKYLPISVELNDAIGEDNKVEGDASAISVTQPSETAKLNDRLLGARQNSAAALPEPIDVEQVDPSSEPLADGEIPNEDASAPDGSEPDDAAPPADPAPHQDGGAVASGEPVIDEAAKDWPTFVAAAADLAKTRGIDPEFFDAAMKAMKVNSKSPLATKTTRDGRKFRSDWLGKFAKGAKLGTDGTLS